jgi:hypothetical protein
MKEAVEDLERSGLVAIVRGVVGCLPVFWETAGLIENAKTVSHTSYQKCEQSRRENGHERPVEETSPNNSSSDAEAGDGLNNAMDPLAVEALGHCIVVGVLISELMKSPSLDDRVINTVRKALTKAHICPSKWPVLTQLPLHHPPQSMSEEHDGTTNARDDAEESSSPSEASKAIDHALKYLKNVLTEISTSTVTGDPKASVQSIIKSAFEQSCQESQKRTTAAPLTGSSGALAEGNVTVSNSNRMNDSCSSHLMYCQQSLFGAFVGAALGLSSLPKEMVETIPEGWFVKGRVDVLVAMMCGKSY